MFWPKKKPMMQELHERKAKQKEWDDTPTVGIMSQQQAEKKAEQQEAVNAKELEDVRKEREEEEKAEDDLKLIIETAKLECKLCSNPQGVMKVNYDTPTIQGKKIATVKEKSPQSLIFMGTCSKSPQSSSPCASVMQLGEWKDIGTSKFQNERVLLQKSTIKCNYGSVDITITDSGQINEPESIDTKAAPVPLNPISVTIGRVIRGNPYVEKNATAVVGLPDSVPLNKTYEVEVVVTGTGTIDLAIINSSADNGNATVTPSSIKATATVIVKGTAMTKPGHGGKLLIEAKVAGVAAANSQPFTVCCHPIDFTDTYAAEVNTPDRLGVIVQDGWSSDNSVFTDLKEVEIKEVVDYVGINDSPPFRPRGGPASNSGYLPGDQLSQDTHSIPRASITLGRAGITEANQLSIYRCKCCGANDIVHPNSGLKRIHEVYNVGTATAPQWKHRTRKIGVAVTINTFITGAGNANVTSQEHNLP